jgi:hypothetical protein
MRHGRNRPFTVGDGRDATEVVMLDSSMNLITKLASGLKKIRERTWSQRRGAVVAENGASRWPHRRCAVKPVEEEEDNFFFPFPKRYPGPGWLLGRATRPARWLRPDGDFLLFFSVSYSFLFSNFVVLNFKSDFKSVLQVLNLGVPFIFI